MDDSPHRNRLASESSAYLLQHASNPVDWFPWGEEALALARSLDRPILLSIGYSACHWCHVMERECFENEEIAALMNRHFVCIKVDREERPDLDHIYMKALQGMTGRGGWPMTVFLTPDAQPFYAGTYFPPEDRSGMPGFPRVLLGVAKAYSEKRSEVDESAARMVEFLAASAPRETADVPRSGDLLTAAAESLVPLMDTEHGGFGRAPKFPGTMSLELLMEAEAGAGSGQFRELVRTSLDAMAGGGIRDHLGGGFHRYSVDRIWLVPHFEKMLYDQALLAALFVEAFRFFDDRDYAAVALEIFDYIAREMTSPDGGFFSAQDADSEGEEGRFFVWTKSEIVDVLGAERARIFCEQYGVTDEGNFEGRSILHRAARAASSRVDERELTAARAQLLARRSSRIAPGTDRKIVTDWNGLMISAMATGASILARDDVLAAAVRAARFIREAMIDARGLQHIHAGGAARVPAFLDDYAFFGRACLDLFAADPAGAHLETAIFCADRLLAEFCDQDAGGFFFTASTGEKLVARTCDLHDGAVPSGNSVAAELLLRLWTLTGEERYRAAGEAVLERFLPEAAARPYGAAWIVTVAARYRRGLKTVVVVGEESARRRLAQAARLVFDPGSTVIALDDADDASPAPALRGKKPPPEGAAAYICEGTTCTMPIVEERELRRALRQGAAHAK